MEAIKTVEIFAHTTNGKTWLRVDGTVVGEYRGSPAETRAAMVFDHWRKLSKNKSEALGMLLGAKVVEVTHPLYVRPLDIPKKRRAARA